MRSNYKRIGDFIKQVSLKNTEGEFDELLGINIDKFFMPSVANVIGTDLKRYKVVKKHQFACNRMHVGRDYRIPIALSRSETPFIVSPAYTVFEITDTSIIDPDYLMMWFSRPEFDREVWFHTDADVRGGLPWGMFCDIELPIPSIEKQRAIVKEYNTVVNRIKLNEELNRKLEETAQAIYKEWFVDFEFPIDKDLAIKMGNTELEGKPFKSSGGEMVWNEELDKEVPEGWEVKDLSDVAKITMGQSPKGETYNEDKIGMIFYQGRTDFGFRIPQIRVYTTDPKRKAKEGDVLMSVRAPVGDLNIANTDCCIGRGLSSIRSSEGSYVFYLMKNFKSLFDSSKGTGTIFSSINKEELHNLKVVYRKEASICFNDLIKEIDKSIIIYCNQINMLSELKSVLLSSMSKVN